MKERRLAKNAKNGMVKSAYKMIGNIGIVRRVGPLRGVGPPTFSTVLPALSYHISLRIGLS